MKLHGYKKKSRVNTIIILWSLLQYWNNFYDYVRTNDMYYIITTTNNAFNITRERDVTLATERHNEGRHKKMPLNTLVNENPRRKVI